MRGPLVESDVVRNEIVSPQPRVGQGRQQQVETPSSDKHGVLRNAVLKLAAMQSTTGFVDPSSA